MYDYVCRRRRLLLVFFRRRTWNIYFYELLINYWRKKWIMLSQKEREKKKRVAVAWIAVFSSRVEKMCYSQCVCGVINSCRYVFTGNKLFFCELLKFVKKIYNNMLVTLFLKRGELTYCILHEGWNIQHHDDSNNNFHMMNNPTRNFQRWLIE